MTDAVLLHCSFVRVVAASGRFYRTILGKVTKWQAKGEDGELPPQHLYVAILDVDVIAAADPRIKYTLCVEQADGHAPWPLEGKLRERQISPPQSFEPNPAGSATMYRVIRVVSLNFNGFDSSLPTMRLAADVLSTAGRSCFTQTFRIVGEAGRRTISSAKELFTAYHSVRSLLPKYRVLAIETLADSWMPAAYTAVTQLYCATPSSLCRLTAMEMASFMAWLGRPEIMRLLPEHAPDIAVLASCMPMATCCVERPLRPCGANQSALAKALAYGDGIIAAIADMPDWAIDIGALIRLENGTYMTARQQEMEEFAAKTLHAAEYVIAITTPGGRGGPGAADLYAKRVPALISVLSSQHTATLVWYIAPTPGHAAALVAAGLDAFSVQDVIGKRTFQGPMFGMPTAICLLFAHAFTLADFYKIIRACPPASAIIMAGDRLAWGGDQGTLFRDVYSAINAGHLRENGKIERVQEDKLHWTAPLYAWPEPSTASPCIECVAVAPSRACTIPLIASRSWPKHRNWWMTGDWSMMPSMGWVGRCKIADETQSCMSRNGTVEILPEFQFGINHMFCCGTEAASLAIHDDFRSIWGAAPARTIAAVSPYYLAEEVAVIVPNDGTVPTMQDVRAAASLASGKVYFVTAGGTRLPLLDAEKNHGRRQYTTLVQTIARLERIPYIRVPNDAPGPIRLQTPCKLLFVGSMDAETMARIPMPTAGDCTTHFRGNLGFQPKRIFAAAAAVQGHVSLARPAHFGLPMPFEPFAADVATAMTRHEINRHVWARLADGPYKLPELEEQDNMDTLSFVSGGKPRTYRDREAVAIHILCLAVKGHAEYEAWYVLHEEFLFYNRLRTAHVGDDVILSLVKPTERAGLDERNIAQTLAKRHSAAVEAYLASRVKEIPDANPIEDDETDEFAFYNMVLAIRSAIAAKL